MIPELGQFCLCLALMVALLQGLMIIAQRIAGPTPILFLTKPCAAIGFLLTTGAFLTLIWSYVVSDFSVLNVVENSNTAKPLIYKITGAWGNHEGSMLLWAEVLAGYGFLIAWFKARDTQLKYTALSVLGLVQFGFLAFILFTSNPFLRVWPMPLNGDDLNPLLQDIGLALHPPTLYTGYVGFGVVFAFAVAGMLRNRIDSDWARAVQPWILLPWSFLTLGIGAGSWWAYRELGWGGWWFWDPVENVSLLPWLSGTALLHATMVLERRGQLARWVAALAILTFSLSLVGTFIVRSGLITSVHAFAADPMRGIFILCYILFVTGSALVIYGMTKFTPTPPVELVSRTGFILLGNLLLVTCAGTVLIAILYPVLLTLLGGEAISVGPHYFDATFLPLAAPLPVLAALAPLMAWDHTGRHYLLRQIKTLLPAVLVALIVCLALAHPFQLEALAGAAIGGFSLYAACRYLQRAREAKITFLSPGGMRFMASFCAHLGLAVFVFGMTTSVLFHRMYEAPLVKDQKLHFGRYTLTLIHAERRQVDNYITRRGDFRVEEDGHMITTLSPELRFYPVRNTQTTEAAIYSTPWHDLYLVIGDADVGGSKIGVRLYVAPGQQLVWLGFLLAGFGGFCALIGAARRLRRAR